METAQQPQPELDPHQIAIRTDLHPAISEVSEAIAATAQDVQHITAIKEDLGSVALLHPDAEARLLIRGLVNVRQTAMRLSDGLAVQAVRDGRLSQIEAATQLRVHQGTISRWIRAAGEDSA